VPKNVVIGIGKRLGGAMIYSDASGVAGPEISIPFERLAKPAQRALAGAGYRTLPQLTRVPESEIAALHGIGPNALKVLRETLAEHGLSFASGEDVGRKS
jgi:hypothetical protein